MVRVELRDRIDGPWPDPAYVSATAVVVTSASIGRLESDHLIVTRTADGWERKHGRHVTRYRRVRVLTQQ